jgi:hypothetical protein
MAKKLLSDALSGEIASTFPPVATQPKSGRPPIAPSVSAMCNVCRELVPNDRQHVLLSLDVDCHRCDI